MLEREAVHRKLSLEALLEETLHLAIAGLLSARSIQNEGTSKTKRSHRP
jgi:hypothetical protein